MLGRSIWACGLEGWVGWHRDQPQLVHHKTHLGIYDSHVPFHCLLEVPDCSLEAGVTCGSGLSLGEGGWGWIFECLCMQLSRGICLGLSGLFWFWLFVGRGSVVELVGIQRVSDIGVGGHRWKLGLTVIVVR